MVSSGSKLDLTRSSLFTRFELLLKLEWLEGIDGPIPLIMVSFVITIILRVTSPSFYREGHLYFLII